MAELTRNQIWVIEELKRQNCDWIAAITEEHWKDGATYYIDDRVGVTRALRKRFLRGNKEAVASRERCSASA